MSLQSLINNIEVDPDVAIRSQWLFDKNTILQASTLKDSELEILKAELQTNGYRTYRINSFLRLVKAKKKARGNLTHIDIANTFIAGDVQLNVKAAKDRIIYARESWHIYKAGVWEVYPDDFFELEVQLLLQKLESEHGHKYTSAAQRSIIDFIRQKLAVDNRLLDANPDLINMQNGVYNIKQQKLMPHDPKYYMTRQSPIPYDPNAKDPTYVHWRESTFGYYDDNGNWIFDRDYARRIDESAGYSLTNDVSHESMFWCIGEGQNGKGVFFHLLAKLGGSGAMSIDLNNLQSNQYQLAMIAGKTILYCTEANKRVNLDNNGYLKALVSGETMMVRQIRERPFELTSTAKIWWSFNNFPSVKDSSHGFWRRVNVYPFNLKLARWEVDTRLKQKLENELPAIFLRWMTAYNTVQLSGAFTYSQLVEETTNHYKKMDNPVEIFIENACTRLEHGEVGSADLYKAYNEWAKDNGFRPVSSRNFKTEIERLGFKYKKKNSGRYFLGLEISPLYQSSLWGVP